MASSVLDAVRIVLLEPQDQVNIAAVVRAMKNMGFGQLVLVRPKLFEPADVERVAHDTRDIVARVELLDTLEEALRDCVQVAAFTARRRAAKRARSTPRDFSSIFLDRAQHGPVALLFGREDRGLPNEALDQAQIVITIPTTNHASLNLSQAVLIALYELHISAGVASRWLAPPRKDAPPASGEQLEEFFTEAERALGALDFYKSRNPEHVMRTVRSLTSRAGPDAREIGLMRAMAIEVLRTLDRVRSGRT